MEQILSSSFVSQFLYSAPLATEYGATSSSQDNYANGNASSLSFDLFMMNTNDIHVATNSGANSNTNQTISNINLSAAPISLAPIEASSVRRHEQDATTMIMSESIMSLVDSFVATITTTTTTIDYATTLPLKLLYYLCYKLRFMFYLVLPSETQFASLEQVPRYVAEMFPIFIFMVVVENLIRLYQGRQALRLNHSVASLSQGVFQECLRIKVRSFEVIMYCLIYNNFRLITLPWQSLWTWWLCYISVDFSFYWAHRIAHEVNFIWAAHQAHHSSEEFSIVTALRQTPLQPFTAWFTYVPLALCIPPQIFLAHLQLSELFMVWLHTEIIDNLGPLEWILNTPSHHRVHHSRNRNYIDKNYGGMLIIWDRLFNTFAKEDSINDPPVYGLVHPMKSFNPFYLQFSLVYQMLKRAYKTKGPINKLFVCIKGPGWRPGLKRMGNIEDIPDIVRPVNSHDPPVAVWRSVYVLVHFLMMILFYHELTMSQIMFSQSVVTIGIMGLLASITSFGFILDNKRYGPFVELLRCLAFLSSEQKLLPIIKDGVQLYHINERLTSTILLAIHTLFKVSVAINLLHICLSLLAYLYKHKEEIYSGQRLIKLSSKLLDLFYKTRSLFAFEHLGNRSKSLSLQCSDAEPLQMCVKNCRPINEDSRQEAPMTPPPPK